MPGKVRFGIKGVRELARERVEQSSLRAVAAEIGMSNSGLYSFLQGGEPYSAVRKKLVAWFTRMRHPESRPIPAAEIDAAASLLAAYIRQAAPAGRERRFMQIFEQIAAEGEIELPPSDETRARAHPKHAARRRTKKAHE